MSTVYINCDGGSRGNPGPSGAACVAYEESDDGSRKCILEKAVFIENKTNNHAEYAAMTLAIDFASTLKCKEIKILSDSKLIVEQMNGNWRVKAQDLSPMYEIAQDKLQKIKDKGIKISISWVPREQNQHADQLANLAMDRKSDAEYKHPSDAEKQKEIVLQAMLKHEELVLQIGSKTLTESWKEVTEAWSKVEI